jgi:microcystin-dependent protein
MSPAMIGNTGQGQGHPNMQPSLCLNFCIAVSGLFPTRG